MISVIGDYRLDVATLSARVLLRFGALVIVAFVASVPVVFAQGDVDQVDPLYIERFNVDVSPSVPVFARLDPDGRRLVLGEFDGQSLSVSIVDSATGNVERRLSPRPLDPTAAVYVRDSDDGRFFAFWTMSAGQQAITVVDLASDKDVARLQLPENSGATVAFSQDGKRIATGWGSGKVALWDVATGQQSKVFDVSSYNSIAFSPDGKFLVLTDINLGGGLFDASWYGYIHMVDIEASRLHFTFSEEDNGFLGAAFSQDGKYVITSNRGDVRKTDHSNASSVTVREMSNGGVIRTLGPGFRSQALAMFNHDGARVFAVGEDRLVRVLDVASGSQITQLSSHLPSTGHAERMRIPAYVRLRAQPGATSFVSFGSEGTVRVWDDAVAKRDADREAFEADLVAAQAGDLGAMFDLAAAYRDGRGVARNDALATQWLTQAADGGHGAANFELAQSLLSGEVGRQDCVAGGQRLNQAVASGSAGAAARLDAVLAPLGGRDGTAALTPQIQADLLEAQIIEVLTRQDYPAFLANLCALEALGHADRLPIEARRELVYHRAAGLRAAGKPRAALAALNQYLNEAGNAGASYTAAIQMLRPLQEEAR